MPCELGPCRVSVDCFRTHPQQLTADRKVSPTIVIASAENFLGLPDRARTTLGLVARESPLLALSLDQPMTAATSSDKRDLTTRDATRYARAHFAVFFVLADTDNPCLTPQSICQRRALLMSLVVSYRLRRCYR